MKFGNEVNLGEFEFLICSFVAGCGSIYAGVWSAPSYKKQTGLILLVLSCLQIGFGMFRTFSESKYFAFAQHIATAIGVVIGYLSLKRDLNLKEERV